MSLPCVVSTVHLIDLCITMVNMSMPTTSPRKPHRNVSATSFRNPMRKPVRKPVRNMSAAKRKMYRRRRIVVGIALLLLIMLVIFCVISLSKGIAAIGKAIAGHEVTIVRQPVPDPRPVGLTPHCTAKDIRLELSTKSQTVPMGGSVELTERFVYEGNSSCLIDASDMNAVLTINSSEEVTQDKQATKDNKKKNSKDSKDSSKSVDYLSHAVWRSDVCDMPLKPLLMAKGDHFEKKITWNTNSTSGKGCTADEDLPKVNRGTYVLRIEHKRVQGLHSEPVLINVQ